jgi:Flp pilus assembly pilin Flp
MLKIELALLVAGTALLLAGLADCLHQALWGRWSR